MTHYRDDDERGESRFARLRRLGKADYHGKGGFLIFVFFRILEFILSIIVLGLAAHFLNIYKFGSGQGLPVLLWVMLAFVSFTSTSKLQQRRANSITGHYGSY